MQRLLDVRLPLLALLPTRTISLSYMEKVHAAGGLPFFAVGSLPARLADAMLANAIRGGVNRFILKKESRVFWAKGLTHR